MTCEVRSDQHDGQRGCRRGGGCRRRRAVNARRITSETCSDDWMRATCSRCGGLRNNDDAVSFVPTIGDITSRCSTNYWLSFEKSCLRNSIEAGCVSDPHTFGTRVLSVATWMFHSRNINIMMSTRVCYRRDLIFVDGAGLGASSFNEAWPVCHDRNCTIRVICCSCSTDRAWTLSDTSAE
jgi:hypothetical protein